jgi:hypothetical protein
MRHLHSPDRAGDGEADGGTYTAIQLRLDDAAIRARQLERARKLGHRLGVEVSIDTTGWLRHEIEIVVDRRPDGTLWPIKVRMGAEATDDAVLEHGGIVAACAQYNGVLVRLRQLAEQVAALVNEERVHLVPGSPLAYAHGNLIRLDELIAQHHGVLMGNGTVRLSTLRREIEYFSRCDAHLTPIVLEAVRVGSSRPPPEQPVATTRWWMRWMRWVWWMRNRGVRRRS